MTAQTVFVSPHLDDAALSCGGNIARLARAGTRVTVVTVFTADQSPGSALSPLAMRTHASWGVGDQPFEARRAEDAAACKAMGADAEHLGLLDAIYRRSAAGEPFYSRVLNAPDPADADALMTALTAALLDSAVKRFAGARVFCPCASLLFLYCSSIVPLFLVDLELPEGLLPQGRLFDQPTYSK